MDAKVDQEKSAPRAANVAGLGTWAKVLDVWIELLKRLCAALCIEDPLAAMPLEMDLSMQAFRWMWTLPPCSAARKAAFTLGQSARVIECFRSLEGCTDAARIDFLIRESEAHLRVLGWRVDDATNEARARRDTGHAPAVPSWQLVYERRASGQIFIEHEARTNNGRFLSEHVLGAHWNRGLGPAAFYGGDNGSPVVYLQEVAARVFEDIAVASLPDGPWTMTTEDVSRFLDMFLEEREWRAS